MMSSQNVVDKIEARIKERWNNEKDYLNELPPIISFEEYRVTCLNHLNLASKNDLQKYTVGIWAVEQKRIDNYAKNINEEIEKLIERIKVLEKDFKDLKNMYLVKIGGKQ